MRVRRRNDQIHPQVPSFQNLMIPTLDIIEENGGSDMIKHINQELLRKFETDPLASPWSESDNTLLFYRAGWARTYLRMFGALTNPSKGCWTLGKNAPAARQTNVDRIVKKAKLNEEPRLPKIAQRPVSAQALMKERLASIKYFTAHGFMDHKQANAAVFDLMGV